MTSVNKAILVGNLGQDPAIKTLDGGVKVATLSLATTETYMDKNNQQQNKTEWHKIVLWRGLAEIAEKYLRKGAMVYIEGKITSRQYEQDGITKYVTEIIGINLVMCGKKGNEFHTQSNEYEEQETNNAQSTKSSNPDKQVPQSVPINNESNDDDLPF